MPTHPAIQLIQSDPERFAAQGAVIAIWRTYRALLHETQEIRRLKREHRRNREHFRKTVIEPLENYVKEIFYLYSNGLYLKGWEVRGFSWGGSFRTDAEVPAHLIPEFPLPLPETLAQIHNQALANLASNQEHHSPAPTSTPSPEFPQSVTQNDSGGTVDFSADRLPLSPTTSENRRCCLQQEDPTDQTTSTHTPDHQPPSPNNTPLRHSNFKFVSYFELRVSNFPKRGHRPRAPPLLPPSSKQHPKLLSP